MKYIWILCLAVNLMTTLCVQLLAVDTPSRSYFIYADNYLGDAFKTVGKTLREDLKEQDYTCCQKVDRDASWAELQERVSSKLLTKDADCFILALGLHDVWNKRKEQAEEITAEDLSASVTTVVNALVDAGKRVVLCTPPALYDAENEAANKQLKLLSQVLKAHIKEGKVEICDIYEACETLIEQQSGKADSNGICMRKGVKLNERGVGLLENALRNSMNMALVPAGGVAVDGVTMKKRDAIYMLTCYFSAYDWTEFNVASKKKYEESMPFETPRMVAKSLHASGLRGLSSIDAYVNQKVTYFVLMPTHEYHEESFMATLKDGSYKANYSKYIATLKEKTGAHIYVITPALWNENDDANELRAGGPMYKASAMHAKLIRDIATETDVSVIDLHASCLAKIQENGGTQGLCFAGKRTTNKGRVFMSSITREHGIPLLKQELIKLFGIEF